MAIDRAALAQAVATHGRVARVVIAEVQGSAPREVGAAMLVWSDPAATSAFGQSGTIGGGTLEWQASLSALQRLEQGGPGLQISRHALGPDLGQCCGGAVTLVCEVFDAARLQTIPTDGLFARGTRGVSEDPPLSVTRALRRWRDGSEAVAPHLSDGWLIEPVAPAQQPVWIWGAGHVGRALVDVLSPLPDLTLSWVDDAPARFPETVPTGVTLLPAPDMPRAMVLAPPAAHHLILTYSHEIDLALCHAALHRGFASCGLIGSATKWARFRKRLTALGHGPAEIARITCPIGDPSLGKHPQAIAVGVAASYLSRMRRETAGQQDTEIPDDPRAADA